MRLVILAALAMTARGEPTPIDSIVVSVDNGEVTFSRVGKKLPSVFVSQNEGSSFSCTPDVLLTKAWVRKDWGAFAEYFAMVAEEAPSAPNATWGLAKKGLKHLSGSQAPGYCNAVAVTVDGALAIRVSHVRACFGSAGCNYDEATLMVTPVQLETLAQTFIERMP